MRVDRGDQDHVPVAGYHRFNRGPGRVVDTHRVDLDDLLPDGRVNRPGSRLRRRDAGAGDHHVDPAELIDRLRDRLFHLGEVGDISGNTEGIAAQGGGGILHGFRIEIEQHH